MGKKEKGSVRTYSIKTNSTEAFIFRGYTDDAQNSSLDSEDSIGPEVVENNDDNSPKIEPETIKTQIIKPFNVSLYKSGNMQI